MNIVQSVSSSEKSGRWCSARTCTPSYPPIHRVPVLPSAPSLPLLPSPDRSVLPRLPIEDQAILLMQVEAHVRDATAHCGGAAVVVIHGVEHLVDEYALRLAALVLKATGGEFSQASSDISRRGRGRGSGSRRHRDIDPLSAEEPAVFTKGWERGSEHADEDEDEPWCAHDDTRSQTQLADHDRGSEDEDEEYDGTEDNRDENRDRVHFIMTTGLGGFLPAHHGIAVQQAMQIEQLANASIVEMENGRAGVAGAPATATATAAYADASRSVASIREARRALARSLRGDLHAAFFAPDTGNVGMGKSAGIDSSQRGSGEDDSIRIEDSVSASA